MTEDRDEIVRDLVAELRRIAEFMERLLPSDQARIAEAAREITERAPGRLQ